MMERSSIDPKTSVLVKVFRDCTSSASSAQSNFDGSAHQNFHGSGNDVYSGLEVWKLNDVVFLDDSPSILGRVVAVDNNQVVVDCSYTQSDPSEGHPSDVPVAKSSLKVFRLSDLEPCIEGPDFFSRQGANVSERALYVVMPTPTANGESSRRRSCSTQTSLHRGDFIIFTRAHVGHFEEFGFFHSGTNFSV